MATYEERLASMKAQRQDNGGVKGLYHANINVLDRNTLEERWSTRRTTRTSPFASPATPSTSSS